MRRFLGGFLTAAGVWHFVKTDFYVRIVPDYLPHPRALVLASGAAAVAAGLLLFRASTARAGAWGAALYFIAVFPANIHMAFHPEITPWLPAWTLWARLPLQAALIAWAYRCIG